MIALDWCSRHPSDFSRVVVMNTSAGALSPPWRRTLPWGGLGILWAGLVARTLEARERATLAVVLNHRERVPIVLANNTVR